MFNVHLENRPEFINRIANSEGVREFIRPDCATMDWTALARTSPALTRTLVLSNGKDALAAFQLTAPGIYQAHTLFARSCRGREALDTARAIVAWMFEHGADVLWGSTPRTNKKACWFNRQIGAHELPTSDQFDVVFEIRRGGRVS